MIRGERVLLDSDLATLYGVETGALVRAVKRNIERFPFEFMFQLDNKEFAFLKCQTGISNTGRGGRRTPPYAFTEQGVAMLSSVLRSKTAIQINITIMNTFVQIRKMIKNDELTKARLDDRFELSSKLKLRGQIAVAAACWFCERTINLFFLMFFLANASFLFMFNYDLQYFKD